MKKKNNMRAEQWFEKAQHDLFTVKTIIDTKGYADVGSVLLQQAVEKYLKGYLIDKGWKLVKTHDLKYLLDQAIVYNESFQDYYELMDILTGHYFEERYPLFDSEITLEELKNNYKKVIKFLELFK